jgi:hypothetical protein
VLFSVKLNFAELVCHAVDFFVHLLTYKFHVAFCKSLLVMHDCARPNTSFPFVFFQRCCVPLQGTTTDALVCGEARNLIECECVFVDDVP